MRKFLISLAFVFFALVVIGQNAKGYNTVCLEKKFGEITCKTEKNYFKIEKHRIVWTDATGQSYYFIINGYYGDDEIMVYNCLGTDLVTFIVYPKKVIIIFKDDENNRNIMMIFDNL